MQQVSYGPLIMSIMLIVSCDTGFFKMRRGWQSLNTGPQFYLRLIRRMGWLWIYTSRTTDGRPFKPKKLSVSFLYPGVPAGLGTCYNIHCTLMQKNTLTINYTTDVIQQLLKVETDVNITVNQIGQAVILVILHVDTFNSDVIICISNFTSFMSHWPMIFSIRVSWFSWQYPWVKSKQKCPNYRSKNNNAVLNYIQTCI